MDTITKQLADALRDLQYATLMRPSCQAGHALRCLCRGCAEVRANKALAAYEAEKAQPAPVVPAWQSIETAPKGGVLVDILCDGRRYAGCHYDRICDEFRHITACGVLVHLKKASHWMAVPAAPKD